MIKETTAAKEALIIEEEAAIEAAKNPNLAIDPITGVIQGVLPPQIPLGGLTPEILGRPSDVLDVNNIAEDNIISEIELKKAVQIGGKTYELPSGTPPTLLKNDRTAKIVDPAAVE